MAENIIGIAPGYLLIHIVLKVFCCIWAQKVLKTSKPHLGAQLITRRFQIQVLSPKGKKGAPTIRSALLLLCQNPFHLS